MANLEEKAEWAIGVYQLETTDPVMGGPNGIDNLQAKQLSNRTQYLKQSLDNLDNKITNVANTIPIVPVQSVNGKIGNINITAADVNALTREQALNEFLPASKKVGNDEQPIYEVGEQVEFKKRPTVNGSAVLIEDELIFAPRLWFSNVPPDGYICLWGQKITQSSAPNLYRLYGEQLPDARDQYLRFSSGNRLPLTLEAGSSISEWVGSANNELWLGITNTDIGENYYEYRKYSSLSAGFGGVGSKFKKIRVQNIAFNLIVRYQ